MKITKEFLENLIQSELTNSVNQGSRIGEQDLHDIISQSIQDSLSGVTRGNIRRMNRVKQIIDEETMRALSEADDPMGGATVVGDWPDSERPPWSREGSEERSNVISMDPMGRAKELAQQGMEDAANTGAAGIPSGLGLFDGKLEDGTAVVDVLNQVRKALNLPGGRPVLEKFDQMLFELGVELGEPPRHDHEGPDTDADELESSLVRMRDKIS